MVNAKKIAEMAGVSRSTVQRALSGNPNIASETKRRVLEIAESLGYTPNKTARALVMRQQDIRYGVIFSSMNNPFYQEVLKGVNAAKNEISDYGVKIDVRFMERISAEKQIELINEFVKEGYKGIAFIPIDTEEVRKAVNAGIAAGTQFITIVTDILETRRLCFVGQDNKQSGKVAGGIMSLMLQRGQKAACVIGSKQYSAHRRRLEGFIDRFHKNHPEGSIADIYENDDDSAISENITKQILSEHPDIRGIFIAGAGVEGVCRVIESGNLGSMIKIICYDLTEDHIQYCRKGIIDIIIDQDPFSEGYQALKILNEYIMFNEIPRNFEYSGLDIRTADNIGEEYGYTME